MDPGKSLTLSEILTFQSEDKSRVGGGNYIGERKKNYEKSVGLVVHIQTSIVLGDEGGCHDLTCTRSVLFYRSYKYALQF